MDKFNKMNEFENQGNIMVNKIFNMEKIGKKTIDYEMLTKYKANNLNLSCYSKRNAKKMKKY